MNKMQMKNPSPHIILLQMMYEAETTSANNMRLVKGRERISHTKQAELKKFYVITKFIFQVKRKVCTILAQNNEMHVKL